MKTAKNMEGMFKIETRNEIYYPREQEEATYAGQAEALKQWPLK
jgi:hypothetical protein